jgi:Mannosyl-glycoprotein endo-beta-N-acetylglucosaminidase/D-alanyl-D-alanine carboxypeptidase
MKRPRRPAAALAATAMCLVGVVIGLPLLAMGAGVVDDPAVNPCLATAPAGVTPIQGAATLTAPEITAWWDAATGGQPPRLGRPINDVIRLYLTEAAAEDVAGDLAFAQAVHETGWFTNSDTAINNFAGIAHPDGTAAGQAFPDVATGVRAHIQLLKRYAAGNDTPLAHADVAPSAGAQADTWEALTGTWATDPGYWTALSNLYADMLAGTDADPPPTQPDGSGADCPTPKPAGADAYEGSPGNVPLARVQGITVHQQIAAQVDALITAAAHDGLSLTGSGYRNPTRQIELRIAHCGTSHYAIYLAPASACSPPTARPGTSMHEVGLAIDFNNCNSHATRCWQWLTTNAAAYGLFNLPSEPWHWSTNGQ